MSRENMSSNVYPGYPSYPYPVYPYPAYQLPSNPPLNNYYPQDRNQRNFISESYAQTDPIKISHTPDQEFQFNALYKKPLESYDFKEFREKTLPMIRIGKLKKIQALVRGWFTRKFILPYKRRIKRIALKCSEDLLEEYIEDNLLPEIILEIINTNFAYKDYSLYQPDFRILLQIADTIENQVIQALCEDVVKDITRFIVNDYLRRRVEDQIVSKKFDALTLLVDEYCDMIIEQDLPILVRDLIKYEADEYLLDANMANMLRNQFIPIYCREIINDAGWEIAEENFLNDCLEYVIGQHINDVIVDSAEAEKDRVDLETLENAFSVFIQRSILREAINELVLLNQEYHDEEYLRKNDDKISEKELSQFMMHEKKNKFDDDFFSDTSDQRANVLKKQSTAVNNEAQSKIRSFILEDKPEINSSNEIINNRSINLSQRNSVVKDPYVFNSDITAPKSPRERKRLGDLSRLSNN